MAPTTPSVRMAGKTVSSDDVAVLDFAGSLPDLTHPLPPEPRLAWAELRAPSAAVELYPDVF
jgi:hypothetical protein